MPKRETALHTPVTETTAPPRPLPGDTAWEKKVKDMIRVDHAGEFGAVRIYAGQAAVLGDRHPRAGLIRHMAEQEEVHLARFNALVNERGVRPTALAPLWHTAGFALGAATAFLGPKAAMACTQAVEDVIDRHYEEQLDDLKANAPETEADLIATIETFQAEEVEHKRIAEEHGAEEAAGYPLLSGLIKAGCHAAIWLAKRV